MIPRIIHYCWFGGTPKPRSVEHCIFTWRKHLPRYRIVEWNESNFDVEHFPYAKEAYIACKFAFVSDVARGYALYKDGGIYLDTDVEVIRSFDPMLPHRSFWGFEAGDFIATSTIGAQRENELVKAYLDLYSARRFVRPDGVPDIVTNVSLLTQLLKERGLRTDNTAQVIGNDNRIYPRSYLSPYDYRTGTLKVEAETVAIHHFSNSWNRTLSFLTKRWLKNSLARFVRKSASW